MQRYMDKYITLMGDFVSDLIPADEFEQRFLEIRREELDAQYHPNTREARAAIIQDRKAGAITDEEYKQRFLRLFYDNAVDHSIPPFSEAAQILDEVFFAIDEFVNDPDAVLPEVKERFSYITAKELREVTKAALEKLKGLQGGEKAHSA